MYTFHICISSAVPNVPDKSAYRYLYKHVYSYIYVYMYVCISIYFLCIYIFIHICVCVDVNRDNNDKDIICTLSLLETSIHPIGFHLYIHIYVWREIYIHTKFIGVHIYTYIYMHIFIKLPIILLSTLENMLSAHSHY
jgi:hypothetical protein